MTGNNVTKLGYLMELLNISISDLSTAINVERSSVSKWKNGTRKFPSDTPYFEGIIDYFIAKNISIGGQILEDFFADIYPCANPTNASPMNDEILKKCIRNYILNIGIGSMNNQIAETQGSLYSSSFTIYRAAEGKQNALIYMLNVAEALSEPSIITIIEHFQHTWASSYMDFFRLLEQRLMHVLDVGHKIELIICLSDDYKGNLEVHKATMRFSFHPNMTIYTVQSRFVEKIDIFVIKDRLAIICHNTSQKASGIVCCAYKDKLVCGLYFSMAQKIKQSAYHMLVTSKPSEVDMIFNSFYHSAYKREAVFHSGNGLSYTTMSEALVNEIIADNMLSPAEKQRIMDFYQVFRLNVDNSLTDSYGGYYLYMDDIIQPLKQEYSTINSLSVVSHKAVRIRRDQIQRHLLETAELIRRNPHYRIILNHGSNPDPNIVWFKDKLWFFAVHTDKHSGKSKVLFNEHVASVEMFKSLYEDIFNRTHHLYKDPEYVSNILIKIANGELS